MVLSEAIGRRPQPVGRLGDDGGPVSFPNLIVNPRAVSPQVPAALNQMLPRLSRGAQVPHDPVQPTVEDLGACAAGMGWPRAGGA